MEDKPLMLNGLDGYQFEELVAKKLEKEIDQLVYNLYELTPEEINIIEDQPEFKRNFGFEVNLGLLKFSRGASEK